MGEKRFAQVSSLPFARLGRIVSGASLASQLVHALAVFADFVFGRAVEMARERELHRSFSGRDGNLHWRGQPSVLGLRGQRTPQNHRRPALDSSARSRFALVFAGWRLHQPRRGWCDCGGVRGATKLECSATEHTENAQRDTEKYEEIEIQSLELFFTILFSSLFSAFLSAFSVCSVANKIALTPANAL